MSGHTKNTITVTSMSFSAPVPSTIRIIQGASGANVLDSSCVGAFLLANVTGKVNANDAVFKLSKAEFDKMDVGTSFQVGANCDVAIENAENDYTSLSFNKGIEIRTASEATAGQTVNSCMGGWIAKIANTADETTYPANNTHFVVVKNSDA